MPARPRAPTHALTRLTQLKQLTHSLTHGTHSLTHSPTHSLTHSLTSLTHSHTLTHTHSLTYTHSLSLTHSHSVTLTHFHSHSLSFTFVSLCLCFFVCPSSLASVRIYTKHRPWLKDGGPASAASAEANTQRRKKVPRVRMDRLADSSEHKRAQHSSGDSQARGMQWKGCCAHALPFFANCRESCCRHRGQQDEEYRSRRCPSSSSSSSSSASSSFSPSAASPPAWLFFLVVDH